VTPVTVASWYGRPMKLSYWLRVTLLEPGLHIGGMVSGGLSRTEAGTREVIGGYALEFYCRAGTAYNMSVVKVIQEQVT
jgi:hypothetical protein